jgi:hypothetical protein
VNQFYRREPRTNIWPDIGSSAAQQEQMPAEGCAEFPLCIIVEEPAEQQQERDMADKLDKLDKLDKQSLAALQAQLAQQQESYRMLYARNLLLYNELTEANKTIARWLELPTIQPSPPRASSADA